MEDDIVSRANVGAARRQARRLLALAKVSEAPILIKDLLSVVRREFNISIYQTNGLPDRCDAITTNIGGEITISCNRSKPINRQKFSAAHELGHLYMGHVHHGFQIDLNSRDNNEIEANAFGAELIMPLSILKKDIAKRGGSIKLLSQKYAVSEEAMGWRIYETGLFKKM